MPPEQGRGEDIDRRADVYAAGVVFWEMLTLKRLFKADHDGALVAMILTGCDRPPRSVNPDIPEAIDDSPDAASCLAAGQEAAHVRYCMDRLKDDHRSAIAMAFYEDMTYGQIAEVSGVPEGTIKTRIFHAKKLLLRCLSGRVQRGALA